MTRERARELAARAERSGDPTGWFETLYREARAGEAALPWADGRPNPHVAAWFAEAAPAFGHALVVGCGLGDDAEWLAACRPGATVTAFDIAPSAVAGARERFPTSSVAYVVADLLALDGAWWRRFDLVIEAYTLQVLPPALRPAALRALAATVAPGGRLVVVTRGRETGEEQGELPWPLVRRELDVLAQVGLEVMDDDDFVDDESPPVRRFRLVARRPDGPTKG